jgi:CheY-like chemotaxis protein
VVVAIKDNGIGIASDHLTRVFEMFSQVDVSMERSQGGLGIGLTLVKRLIEMHGGSVTANSQGPGTGAEFVVRLPMVFDATQRPHSQQDEVPQKSSLRILIVDDNQDSAQSLAMLLRLLGNDTRTAYDGEQGVELVDVFRPDVVLLDIGLPKLNGYEACQRIRRKPGGESLVLIAVTGWGQEEDRRRAFDAGFDHHLTKPVVPQELMKLLVSSARPSPRPSQAPK